MKFRVFVKGKLMKTKKINLSNIKHFINYGPYTQILVETKKGLKWMCVNRSYGYFKEKMSLVDVFQKVKLRD